MNDLDYVIEKKIQFCLHFFFDFCLFAPRTVLATKNKT